MIFYFLFYFISFYFKWIKKYIKNAINVVFFFFLYNNLFFLGQGDTGWKEKRIGFI